MRTAGTDHGAVPLTRTHARLRAEQGDLSGARRVLRAILALRPHDQEALAMLRGLEGRVDRRDVVRPAGAPAPRQPGDPARLAAEFRRALGAGSAVGPRSSIPRLERWLSRITRDRSTTPMPSAGGARYKLGEPDRT